MFVFVPEREMKNNKRNYLSGSVRKENNECMYRGHEKMKGKIEI
jgi:hypothetical protein